MAPRVLTGKDILSCHSSHAPSEKTGRVVEGENKARGYELKRGSYVEIEPDELEAVEVESTRAIDIDKFVPEEEIDKRYYESPYYIVPDDKSGDCLE